MVNHKGATYRPQYAVVYASFLQSHPLEQLEKQAYSQRRRYLQHPYQIFDIQEYYQPSQLQD